MSPARCRTGGMYASETRDRSRSSRSQSLSGHWVITSLGRDQPVFGQEDDPPKRNPARHSKQVFAEPAGYPAVNAGAGTKSRPQWRRREFPQPACVRPAPSPHALEKRGCRSTVHSLPVKDWVWPEARAALTSALIPLYRRAGLRGSHAVLVENIIFRVHRHRAQRHDAPSTRKPNLHHAKRV